MWEIELLEIQKKLLAKIKIQCFEFKASDTKSFTINWNSLAKTFL